MATHLVIGDPHCTPSASNERFTWAGRMARDIKADKVICMGDFASMESLSSWDRGKKSFDDLQYPEYGWNTYTYRYPLIIDGIHYSHNFPSGLMGSPISGENVARTLLNKNKVSSTVGHCHLLDYAVSAYPSGKKIMGLSAGCYLTHKESYAYNTQRLWWSGLIVKRNVKGGEYDIEMVNSKEVKKRYGRPSK